ncbi:MAG: protein-glutamate O-methyltransferase CheR [Alphaproteobacteria bacterium]|nr:protein-glutamate O-methyltransferase CheR [Alphaproteobacteria bacterium]
MKKSDFDYILLLLKRYAGWDLTTDNYFLIDNKIYGLVCEKGYASSDDLIQELRLGQKSMLWQVIEALTFSETYFFRDYPVFKSFEKIILPRIREVNRSSKKLRIWSLGCSTGQETYSIGMSIADNLPAVSDWNVNILGTDISSPAITKAQKGIYTPLEVQMGLNIKQIIKHFHKEGNNWAVNQDISNNIKFLRYNLLEYLSNVEPFDIIFCRYVLNYFTPEKQRELIAKIHSYNVPAGFLYLGLHEKIDGLEEYYDAIPGMPCLYQAKLKPQNITKNRENLDNVPNAMPTLQRPSIKNIH